MDKIMSSGSVDTVATMEMAGVTYDIIRFGYKGRLRIVGRESDRTLDSHGYRDTNEIRKAYPAATVR